MTAPVVAALLVAAAGPVERVAGELVAADFTHRAGRFRPLGGGVARPFVLPPDAAVRYRGAEADLRDIPLGTPCDFVLRPDADGGLTRLAVLRDRLPPDPAAAEAQFKRHVAFVKDRGVPAVVDRTRGVTLTVSLLGDPAAFDREWSKDFVAGRGIKVAVANDELRTWNPPVDQEYGKLLEVRKLPAAGPGRSGVQLVLSVRWMLEGFRQGRVVRVIGGPWKSLDQPFGEQLFHYGSRPLPPELAELPPKEYPTQFPFRTDHGNRHLPWYSLRPGVEPPPFAEHLVCGELVRLDPVTRAGQFLADGTGTAVDFTLTPEARLTYLNAEVGPGALPAGTRFRFHLFQDAAGAFTRVGFVSDEVSHLILNGAVWRVEAVFPDRVYAARQPPAVKNDQGDTEQPPDIGRAELRVGPDARVWKPDARRGPGSLAVGDLLLVNESGERPGHPAACTEVWVGADTHRLFAAPPKRPAPAPPKKAAR